MPEHEIFLTDEGEAIHIDTSGNSVILHDYDGGNRIRIWHNGERWIVRHDARALGDHNNFECVDQWELRSETEAHEQFVDGLEDECND